MTSHKLKPPHREGDILYSGPNQTDKIRDGISSSLHKAKTVRVSIHQIHEALMSEGESNITNKIVKEWLERVSGDGINYSRSTFGDEYSFTEDL